MYQRHLTPREVQVASLVGQHHTDSEIAAILGIAERTARLHVANAKQKLGFSNRRELARYAAEHLK